MATLNLTISDSVLNWLASAAVTALLAITLLFCVTYLSWVILTTRGRVPLPRFIRRICRRLGYTGCNQPPRRFYDETHPTDLDHSWRTLGRRKAGLPRG